MDEPAVDINAPDIAAQVERLSPAEIDKLPFGVILLDREFMVLIYNATEARESGYRNSARGLNFFSVAQYPSAEQFRVGVTAALEAGPVDLEFAWKGDYSDPNRELRIRAMSARNGGIWMFVERD